jgi:surface antigen
VPQTRNTTPKQQPNQQPTQKPTLRRPLLVPLAIMSTLVASIALPTLRADAATKSVSKSITKCITKKGKRTCKIVRVRTATPSKSPVGQLVDVAPTPVVSAPTQLQPPAPAATVAAPVAAPVVTVVVTPVSPTPNASVAVVTPSPELQPTIPTASVPATIAPAITTTTTTKQTGVVVTPVAATPLPPVSATPTPAKSTTSTPSTPTVSPVGSGMVHRVGDAPSDNYPIALKNAAQGSTYDALRFPNRECTSFVALRLAANGRPLDSFFYETTSTWADRAAQAGYVVDTNPRPGDIAHWVANERQTFPDGSWSQAGPVGHVGYVAAVNPDGTVTLEEYNGANVRGTYSVRYNTRAPRYIHYKN